MHVRRPRIPSRVPCLVVCWLTLAADLLQGQESPSSAEPEFPARPELSAEFRAAFLESTVHLHAWREGRFSSATGVCVGRQGRTVYVLSAYHVIAAGDSYSLDTCDGEGRVLRQYRRVELVAQWKEKDLALLSFRTDRPPRCAALGRTAPRGPFWATGVGCNWDEERRQGQGPTVHQQLAAAEGRYGHNGFDFHAWFTEAASVSGRSGGPLLDAEGYVVGLCHGGDRPGAERPRSVHVHLREIHAFLDRVGMAWLYRDGGQ
jgi:S1-C subfamily serine protease